MGVGMSGAIFDSCADVAIGVVLIGVVLSVNNSGGQLYLNIVHLARISHSIESIIQPSTQTNVLICCSSQNISNFYSLAHNTHFEDR